MDKQLLQDLWDQFCAMSSSISDLADDEPFDKEPFASLHEIVGDTDEMKLLRKRLHDAGVKIAEKFHFGGDVNQGGFK